MISHSRPSVRDGWAGRATQSIWCLGYIYARRGVVAGPWQNEQDVGVAIKIETAGDPYEAEVTAPFVRF
jgi:hypothetical protein